MSVLINKSDKDLKLMYNHNLKRYVRGCEFLDKNPTESDKWIDELVKIVDNLNEILLELKDRNYEPTDEEVLNGLKI